MQVMEGGGWGVHDCAWRVGIQEKGGGGVKAEADVGEIWMVGCKGSGWVWPQWLSKIRCKCAHMYVCVCLHVCVVLSTCLCSRMQTGREKPDGNVIVSAALLPVSRHPQFVCCFIHSAYRRWHCLGKWGFHSFKQNTCDLLFRLKLCTFGSTISEILCFGSAVFLKLCALDQPYFWNCALLDLRYLWNYALLDQTRL